MGTNTTKSLDARHRHLKMKKEIASLLRTNGLFLNKISVRYQHPINNGLLGESLRVEMWIVPKDAANSRIIVYGVFEGKVHSVYMFDSNNSGLSKDELLAQKEKEIGLFDFRNKLYDIMISNF